MPEQGESSADSKALVGLLSPHGRLMHAIQSADADQLIQFNFPLERLPSHTQMLLASDTGRCGTAACMVPQLLLALPQASAWQQAADRQQGLPLRAPRAR